MPSDTSRDLPEFTTILNEVPALIADLTAAAARYNQRADSQRAFSVVMLIDMLDLVRDLMYDLQGFSGPELDTPDADSFSLN